MFEKIDSVFAHNESHFNKFFFNNTAITKLEENTFREITFDEIEIYNATKLNLINTYAFTSNNEIIKRLYHNLLL